MKLLNGLFRIVILLPFLVSGIVYAVVMGDPVLAAQAQKLQACEGKLCVSRSGCPLREKADPNATAIKTMHEFTQVKYLGKFNKRYQMAFVTDNVHKGWMTKDCLEGKLIK